jgi:hypothetical protein
MKPSQQLSADLGNAVIARLEQIATIPYEEGLVAGQAVSSAVLELLGLPGGAVYNDIDIFVDSAWRFRDSDDEVRADEEDCAILAKSHQLQTWYGELRVIGHDDCTLVSSREEGKLNILETYFECRQDFSYLYPQQLIAGFDLNCVQAAVCLKTRKLFWTSAFEAFTRSQQLELTSLYTPVHSLLRLLKKRDELNGVFVNVPKALEIVKFALSHSDEEAFSKGPTLGPKAQALFARYAQELAAHLVLDNSVPTTGAVIESRESNPVVRVVGAVDPRLEETVRLLCEYRVDAGRGSYLNRALMAAHLVYDKHSEPLRARLEHFKLCDDAGILERLFIQGPSYLNGNISLSDLRRVFKLTREHPRLPLDWLQKFSHCMEARTVIRACIEHYGLWVVGSFETREVPLIDMSGAIPRVRSFNEMKPEFDVVQKDVHTPLRSRVLGCIKLNGMTVEELDTRAKLVEEGARLHHCVGGYGSVVKQGAARVFSIRSGPKATDCSTLELCQNGFTGGKVWEMLEHKSFANNEPSRAHRAIVDKIARLATHNEYASRWEILKVDLHALYFRKARPRIIRARRTYRDFRSGIKNMMEGRPFREDFDIPF